jgi:leucine dehydrogenase
VIEALGELGVARCLCLHDAPSGLRALMVIDDVTLGPAAGGVRTRAYPNERAALEDCARLARAMTVKCALAGLSAGGGKAVVLDHPGLDRAAAFERLGERIQELGGLFRTAGDLGTTAADLAAMARRTRFVHTDERGLSEAVARGLLRCLEACAELRGVAVAGLRVAVQGAGAVGAAVARALAAAGLRVIVADVDAARAAALATELDAEVCDAAAVLTAPVDVVAPCALGGVLDHAAVQGLRAWAVCGAANNVLAEPALAATLKQRGILFVPDGLASAGAVIAGIGRSVMGLHDPTPLVDALGATALTVLREAAAGPRTTLEVAEARAWARISSRSG